MTRRTARTMNRERADEFFLKPALSLSQQPELSRLMRIVADGATPITLVLGAGLSKDAGLPDWPTLLQKMAESLVQDRWRAAALADDSDPLRKAEYLTRMVPEGSSHTPEEVVREALYPGGTTVEPGELADAVARLAHVLQGRVRVVTTNFDGLYEAALRRYDPVEPTMMTLEDFPGGVVLPGQLEGPRHVAHLHGLLLPNVLAKGPVILSESSFLTHGPDVHSIMRTLVAETVVVFVGVSLADPNLVRPLWDTRHHPEGCDRPFFFVVAGGPGNDSVDPDTARAYLIKRSEYLAAELDVAAIFLKSYAQLAQVMYELSIAAREPDRYLDNSGDAANSIRYGSRLRRALERCHENLGSVDFATPVGPSGLALSTRMRDLLHDPNDGITPVFERARKSLARTKDAELRALYAGVVKQLDAERFGLFLWLRDPMAPDGEAFDYQLHLIGSSAYTHTDSWSITPPIEIRGDSPYPAATSAFNGQVALQDFPDLRDWRLWRSCLSVPFTLEGTCLEAEVVNGHAIDRLTVGVITLNSTHEVTGSEGTPPSPASVLTLLAPKEMDDVENRLAAIGRRLVSERVVG